MRIIICGDFYSRDLTNFSISKDLKEYIKSADVSVVNFEAPISAPLNPIVKSGPVLSQDNRAIGTLRDIGFDVFLCANNHIMDYGREGCENTICQINKCGGLSVGAGPSEEAYKFKIVEIESKKIGFLSFVQYEFGITEFADENSYGTAWINSPCVSSVINDAKKKVDWLCVFPHAGVEFWDAPLPEWRRVYKGLVDMGADAIVASHPHVEQGYELYKDKPIFYSLGNFYFDRFSDNEKCTNSFVVELSILDNITFAVHEVSFFNSTELHFLPEDECSKKINYLNSYLLDEDKYMNYINLMVKKAYSGYMYGILRGVKGFSFLQPFKKQLKLLAAIFLNNSDEATLLNSIRCESHRWAIERYLKNMHNLL